ncbi:ABC transporter ATP-binding protein [Defluviitalea phaphyphila]|uniref:ABC transporter ATP-binding protein n=1 Tax=Defluviitalea phaphyphila TaxID=1473580 RepID=UPI000731280E|nr:ABC transporter ATP-binding protein [Defluviitalea phaphyphila]
MKRVAKYFFRYWKIYFLGFMAMMISLILDMFNPQLNKIIIDDVILGGDLSIFKRTLLALIGITISRGILGYAKEMIFDVVSSKVVVNIRKDLFEHIQSLSFSFFDGINTGELMSRIKEDVDNIWKAVGFGIMLFLEQGLYFIVASIMLFTLNFKLALICLAFMPFIGFIALKLEKKIGEAYEKISDQGAVLNTTAQENIAGVRLVKAFGRERYEIEKFLKENEKNFNLNLEQASIWGKYNPRIEFLSNLVIVAVTTIGGFLVIKEDMSIGTLVAFSNYIFMLIWPMRMLGWLTNILAQAMASSKKLEKIFKEKPKITSPKNAIKPKKIKGHIVFDKVGLELNETKILEDISFEAKPGQTIGIMGSTGSGKSSIINLIGRYYDSTKGRILVDGIDVKNMDLKTLRKNLSVVMQDTFLFSDTIEENIKFGNMEATNEELIEAAKDSDVHSFVLKMPEGYKTVIGERGLGLSGGQKQRISIARALIKNSPILILDDATSALDMETEYQIQKAIERRKGITKIIIAHRISAVKNADEILILEGGKIVERGNHKTLLKKKGRYYDIYCQQFKGFKSVKEEVI